LSTLNGEFVVQVGLNTIAFKADGDGFLQITLPQGMSTAQLYDGNLQLIASSNNSGQLTVKGTPGASYMLVAQGSAAVAGSTLTVSTIAINTGATKGDFDHDGDTDGRDFLIWQRTFGSTNSLIADANYDARVDSADYAIWRRWFGTSHAVAVPLTAGEEFSASSVLTTEKSAVAGQYTETFLTNDIVIFSLEKPPQTTKIIKAISTRRVPDYIFDCLDTTSSHLTPFSGRSLGRKNETFEQFAVASDRVFDAWDTVKSEDLNGVIRDAVNIRWNATRSFSLLAISPFIATAWQGWSYTA
jgi:hypothetical protein